MIAKQEESVGYLIKGGSGSGNFGHTGIPGHLGGSVSGVGLTGGSDKKIRQAFESMTLPLRSKLKFDDQVVFLDKDDNVVSGAVTYGGKDVNPKTHIAVQISTGTIVVPREHLRMPKGGVRTRGEEL